MIRTRRCAAALALLVILLGACSGRQQEPQPTLPLFEDLGSHHHPITTSNENAQKYFDQGLRLVFGFNHDEAERAFREAARLDPESPMPWWGVAYALGPNFNLPLDEARNERALDAVRRAKTLLPNANDQERGYIEAIGRRYAAGAVSDRAQLDHDFSNAMKELAARFPDDVDAAVLYAESLMDLRPWRLWTADGKPQEGTEEIVKTLESVLARDPDHPGANHYYIHAIEASPNPEKGAESAERLRTLVPGAGHLVHMPAHIYIRTGDYEGAVEANANAARVDEAYIARTNAQGVYPMMYYTHNFMFLSAAAGMLGQSQKAIEAAEKAVAIAAPMAAHEPMAEYVLPFTLYALMRSSRWDDILAYPQPAESTTTTVAFWRFARVLAHLQKGDLNAAREDRRALESATSKVPEDLYLNTNRAHDLLSIAAAVADARLAGASGNGAAAITFWKMAIGIQDRLVYDEPPAWYYPARESLGGEYLRSRRFAEAEQIFREDLNVNPRNPRSLFGLREALRSQSKTFEDAGRQFEELWREAEAPLNVENL
jgi:tetratricopeptide (TPR) repeat protein